MGAKGVLYTVVEQYMLSFDVSSDILLQAGLAVFDTARPDADLHKILCEALDKCILAEKRDEVFTFIRAYQDHVSNAYMLAPSIQLLFHISNVHANSLISEYLANNEQGGSPSCDIS